MPLEPADQPGIDGGLIPGGGHPFGDGRIEPLDLSPGRGDQFVPPVKVLPGLCTAHQEHPNRVGPELLDRVLEQEDIPLAGGHLGPVQQPHPKDHNPLRLVLLREDRDMVEDLEGQMVGDQVLSREPEVIGVPVHELRSDRIQRLPDRQVRRFGPEEDVVKDRRRQQRRIDLPDPVGDRIVGHVDRRVAERLKEPGRVPGNFRTQPDPAGAGPVLQPVHGPFELGPDLGRNQLDPWQVLVDLLLPDRIAVLQEPLVVQDLHIDPAAAPADHRPVVELVHHG